MDERFPAFAVSTVQFANNRAVKIITKILHSADARNKRTMIQKKKTIENVKLNRKLNWLNSLVGLSSQLQRTHCAEREHVCLQEVISVQLRLPRGWHRCADRKTQRNTLSEHTVPQQSRQLWDFQLDAFRVSAARPKT